VAAYRPEGGPIQLASPSTAEAIYRALHPGKFAQ